MKHLIIIVFFSLGNLVFAQMPPTWSAFYGGFETEIPTKIIADDDAIYVISNVFLEEPMLMEFFDYGIVAKFDAVTGAKMWDYRTDQPSYFTDLILDTASNRLLIVGRTDPFRLDFDNESLMLSVDASSGTLLGNVSIKQEGQETFTRIVRHPDPADDEFPYYVIGTETPGSFPANDNRPVLMTFDAELNAGFRRQYETSGKDLESANGLVVLANGNMLLLGRDGETEEGIVLLVSKSGDLIKAFEYEAGTHWFDGSEMPDGKVVLAGHLSFAGQGIVSLLDPGTGIIEQSVSFPDTREFWEVNKLTLAGDPRTGLYVASRRNSSTNQRNVITTLVYEPGGPLGIANFVSYDDDSFTLTPPKLFVDDMNKRVFYVDGRETSTSFPGYAGIGSTDLFIAASPPDMETGCFEGDDIEAQRPGISNSSFTATTASPDWVTEIMFFSMPSYPGECNPVCTPPDPCTDFSVDLTVEAECFEGTYTATVTGGQGPFSYEWDFCNSAPPVTTTSPTIDYSALSPAALCYDATVTVTDANGCVTAGTVLLRLENEPPVLICPDTTVVLVADSGQCYATHDIIFSVTDDCNPNPQITSRNCNAGNRSPGSGNGNSQLQLDVGTDCVIINAWDGFATGTSRCRYEVLVLDREVPTCSLAPIFSFPTTRCGDGAEVTWPEDFFDDNCFGEITYSYDPTGPGNGAYFPLGTTEVTAFGTDTSGNRGECLISIVVERGCGTPGVGELKCREGGYVLEVPYTNGTGGSNADCSFRATIDHPAFPGVFTGNGSAVPGKVIFFLTTDELVFDPFVSVSMTTVCQCDDGAFSRCSYGLSADVECCLELTIPDTVICETQTALEVPILDLTGIPGITQVRYYVADSGGSFGTPLQITNGYQPLDLAPTYHAGNIMVYAEVDFAGSACTTVTTNVAHIQRCSPVTGSVPSQAYCYDGSPVQPDPLVITLGGGDPALCGDSIQWYGPDGVAIPNANDLSYLPNPLTMTGAATDCDQRFVYSARIFSVCGFTTATAEIRLFNENDPVGELTLDPIDTNPLCPGEDAILHYAPACTGDEMMWTWWESTDGINFTALTDAGTQNPVYYTNRLYQDTWYQVRKQNGVCPVDAVTLFLNVREELVLNDFQASFDDPCLPTSVNLMVQADFPVDCPQRELSWYRNGILLATTNDLDYSYVPAAGGEVAGNYEVVVSSPCCGQQIRSAVISLTPPPRIAIAGPCFICNSDPAELSAVIEGATDADVGLQWYADGAPLVGETGPTLEIFDDTGDSYTLEMTDVNGCVSQASFTPYERCFIVGVEDLPVIDAQVFPNPATDRLFVEMAAPITFRELTLYDALGRPVRSVAVGVPQERIEIPLAGLAAGLYFLQGTTGQGVLLREVVVE